MRDHSPLHIRCATLLMLAAVAAGMRPSALRAADTLPARMLAADLAALNEFWEKHKRDRLTVKVFLPPPSQSVPPSLERVFPGKRYAHFRMGPNFYLLVSKRADFHADMAAGAGRACSVQGNLTRVKAGRSTQDGSLLYTFCLEVRRCVIFSPPAAIPSAADFKAESYPPCSLQELSREPDRWAGKRCRLKCRVSELRSLESRYRAVLGPDAAKWTRLLPADASEQPLLLLSPATLGDMTSAARCKPGSTVFVYGRVFRLPLPAAKGEMEITLVPALLAHASCARLLKAGETPGKQAQPVLPVSYAAIDKSLLLPITIEGIYHRSLPTYRASGNHIEFVMVYRGHSNPTPALRQALPPAVRDSLQVLATRDNGMPTPPPLILAPKALLNRHPDLEQGDTTFLRCAIRRLGTGKTYCLLVREIVLPPIQP